MTAYIITASAPRVTSLRTTLYHNGLSPISLGLAFATYLLAMAHIFSFDPSPPHPASPWENKEDDSEGINTRGRKKTPSSRSAASRIELHDSVGVHKDARGLVGTKGLISEPQVGSTEYKLHLLKEGKSSIRLEQLTTQLLWRLQQSNPYVSSAFVDMFLSSFSLHIAGL